MSANNSILIDPSPYTTVDNGGSIMFNCTAEGGPNNMFTWVRTVNLGKIDTNIQANETTTPIDVQGLFEQISDIILVNNSISLSLDYVNSSFDGGSYTCLVINEAGIGREESILYVRPVITVQPMDVLTLAGEQVVLTCFADSFPPPQYQWEMMNRSTGMFDRLQEENGTSLVLESIEFKQYGRYRCKAIIPIINVNTSSNEVIITGEIINYYETSTSYTF